MFSFQLRPQAFTEGSQRILLGLFDQPPSCPQRSGVAATLGCRPMPRWGMGKCLKLSPSERGVDAASLSLL